LHLLRILDNPQGAQNLEADYPAVIAEVGDDARANLVTLLDRRLPESNER
jgi:hypothetical protein